MGGEHFRLGLDTATSLFASNPRGRDGNTHPLLHLIQDIDPRSALHLVHHSVDLSSLMSAASSLTAGMRAFARPMSTCWQHLPCTCFIALLPYKQHQCCSFYFGIHALLLPRSTSLLPSVSSMCGVGSSRLSRIICHEELYFISTM